LQQENILVVKLIHLTWFGHGQPQAMYSYLLTVPPVSESRTGLLCRWNFCDRLKLSPVPTADYKPL